MFQKKDYVVTSAQGVCIVADVPNLVVGKEQKMQYYLLCSIEDKKKRCYIPVENHETIVRQIMNKGEALEIRNNLRKSKQEILQETPDFSMAKEWFESVEPGKWGRACVWLKQQEKELPGNVKEMLQKSKNNLLQEWTYIFREEEEGFEFF